MGPDSRRVRRTERTDTQLFAWLDRLTEVLPRSVENHDNPGHALSRSSFLMLLRTQVPRMLADPASFAAAKQAVRAYVSDRVTDAVEWLAATCGEPSSHTPAA